MKDTVPRLEHHVLDKKSNGRAGMDSRGVRKIRLEPVSVTAWCILFTKPFYLLDVPAKDSVLFVKHASCFIYFILRFFRTNLHPKGTTIIPK